MERDLYQKKVEQYITNKVARSNNSFDAHRLACEAALDNFASSTWLNNYIDELIFLLKWRSKLAQQGARIMFVNELRQKFKSKCKLNTSSLAV